MIRPFAGDDVQSVVSILEKNGQYANPEIDGPDAMLRASSGDGRVFLVAESEGRVVGSIRGVYEGSRALIHQVTVDPEHQGKGIGRRLVVEITKRFREMGAPTVSVTAANGKDGIESTGFFERLGFKELPIVLMVNYDIDGLIGED